MAIGGTAMEVSFTITKGADYIYQANNPPGCKGCRYRVKGFVLYVPVGQELVLAQALEGPHKGLLFVCSQNNFATRYLPAPAKEEAK